MTAYHTYLAVGAYHRLDGSVGRFSSRVLVDRMFAGAWAWRGERASCSISLESEFGGKRRIANIGDINEC